MFARFALAVCVLASPVQGEVISDYSPGADGYSGHWGVDIESPSGSMVNAPADGIVTYAGSVAGMITVTIRFDSDFRVSISHLSEVLVEEGDLVRTGDVIARSGLAHGLPGVHVSVRRGALYVDPTPFLVCADGVIRLLPDR